MNRLIAFVASFANWTTLRFGISGASVGAFTLGMPILLNAVFGWPIEACIPGVYLLGVVIQFTLQRVFVFRHVKRFALPMRRQILWYVVIVCIQYPTNAAATAVLPGVLHIPQRIVYVGVTLVIALLTLLFLRRNVFHAHEELEEVVEMIDAHLPGDHAAAEPAPARVP